MLNASSRPLLGVLLRKKVMSFMPRLCSAQRRCLTPTFFRHGDHPMQPNARTVRPKASQKYLPKKGFSPHKLPVADWILPSSFLTLAIQSFFDGIWWQFATFLWKYSKRKWLLKKTPNKCEVWIQPVTVWCSEFFVLSKLFFLNHDHFGKRDEWITQKTQQPSFGKITFPLKTKLLNINDKKYPSYLL